MIWILIFNFFYILFYNFSYYSISIFFSFTFTYFSSLAHKSYLSKKKNIMLFDLCLIIFLCQFHKILSYMKKIFFDKQKIISKFIIPPFINPYLTDPIIWHEITHTIQHTRFHDLTIRWAVPTLIESPLLRQWKMIT